MEESSMIKIVTDSSAHLPAEDYARWDITVVPLKVIFGEQTYREGIDLSNGDFYRLLRESRELPTTTQPSAGEFLEVYRRLTDAGHSIISIHLSSKLSGTYSSAAAARDLLPDRDITVVDTPWISHALGMLAREAARAAQAGQSKDEILALIHQLSEKLNIIFVVDTLEYLQKGGRIGGAQALVGTLLKIKPILQLENGRIEPLDKVRTKQAAVRRLIEVMDERVNHNYGVHVGILHGEAPEEARALEAEVRRRFKIDELYLAEVGPVVGTHTGPGVVGVAFYNGDRAD
jgi:DegV family protein with EDD domain